MISVIILAAGKSTRFKSDKLLWKIDNETVIEKSIKKFINNKTISEVIVVTRKDKEDFLKSLPYNLKIQVVDTDSRSKSTKEGIKLVTNPKVLIHDGARCFVENDTIEKVIQKLKVEDAVIPVRKATSTFHLVNNGFLSKLIDRKNLVEAQTPQGFNTTKLKEILDKGNLYSTDEATMFFNNNIPVAVVEVEDKNIKITLTQDVR